MIKALEKNSNKECESYTCLFSDSEKRKDIEKRKLRNKKHSGRRKLIRRENIRKATDLNQKHKNFSKHKMTTDQTNLLAKGLKFIPTPIIEEKRVKQQLLLDFKQFARRTGLQQIFHGKDSEPHPFYVKSNREPPVQRSFALETFLEEIKTELAEIKLTQPKPNLPYNERKAIRELRANSKINIKKADKGTTTAIMNKQVKIQQGLTLLHDRNNYVPLETPMIKDTFQRVQIIINDLHLGGHTDDMTKKWLSQTPNQPRIPVFYTLKDSREKPSQSADNLVRSAQ